MSIVVSNSTDLCTFGNFRDYIFPLVLPLKNMPAEKHLPRPPELEVWLPGLCTVNRSGLSAASRVSVDTLWAALSYHPPLTVA